ncbi:MAG TPA: acetyl-CoA carboxylase biotin carboxyl carrier protein [Planctomycetota bacterium]|nr:acetyl-CoA carboxylase biotin carboxyl carrier protein [Planctomycetota bacterium]
MKEDSPMDPKNLKRIVELMNQHDLAEVEIEEEGRRLRLRKTEARIVAAPAAAPAAPAPAAPAAAAAPEAPSAPAPAAPKENLLTIKAPMVGTFYRSPSPDSDPYVEVGRRVTQESVVCILEAMKVMNEIKAECTGEIVKVSVQNGEAVEYDQPLFLVKPD